MFTLNQTFTINMCATHCNLKSISFSFSLFLCVSLSVCASHFVFVFFHSFSSIYAKLKASLFVLCFLFSFILLPILKFYSALRFRQFYTLHISIHHILSIHTQTLGVLMLHSRKLSQTLRFFSFVSYFLYYLFVIHVRFCFVLIFFLLSLCSPVIVVVHFFPL